MTNIRINFHQLLLKIVNGISLNACVCLCIYLCVHMYVGRNQLKEYLFS